MYTKLYLEWVYPGGGHIRYVHFGVSIGCRTERVGAVQNSKATSKQGGINFLAASGHRFSKILASRAVFEIRVTKRFIYTLLNQKKVFWTLKPQFSYGLSGQSRPLRQ